MPLPHLPLVLPIHLEPLLQFPTPIPGLYLHMKAFSQTLISSASVNLSALLGGALGGSAGLVAIVAAVVFLKKRKSHYAALDESRKPDPFPATPAPARARIVPLPVQSQTDKKRRLAARDMALLHSPGQSHRESGDFHILSAVDR